MASLADAPVNAAVIAVNSIAFFYCWNKRVDVETVSFNYDRTSIKVGHCVMKTASHHIELWFSAKDHNTALSTHHRFFAQDHTST